MQLNAPYNDVTFEVTDSKARGSSKYHYDRPYIIKDNMILIY